MKTLIAILLASLTLSQAYAQDTRTSRLGGEPTGMIHAANDKLAEAYESMKNINSELNQLKTKLLAAKAARYVNLIVGGSAVTIGLVNTLTGKVILAGAEKIVPDGGIWRFVDRPIKFAQRVIPKSTLLVTAVAAVQTGIVYYFVEEKIDELQEAVDQAEKFTRLLIQAAEQSSL